MLGTSVRGIVGPTLLGYQVSTTPLKGRTTDGRGLPNSFRDLTRQFSHGQFLIFDPFSFSFTIR